MFITVKQLAERWGYQPDSVYKGLKKNPEQWPRFIQAGKNMKILFSLSDVEDFENNRNTKKY